MEVMQRYEETLWQAAAGLATLLAVTLAALATLALGLWEF
jgi:hypothetical protein